MFSQISIFLLKLYKKYISRFTHRVCLFNPTCSEYAQQEIVSQGVWAARTKIIERLRECNGDYSLSLNSKGEIELASHSGIIYSEQEVSTELKEKMNFIRDFTQRS